MIVFETQEAFEDAVMEVIKKRLRVEVKADQGYYSTKVDSLDVKLKDGEDEFTVSYVWL